MAQITDVVTHFSPPSDFSHLLEITLGQMLSRSVNSGNAFIDISDALLSRLRQAQTNSDKLLSIDRKNVNIWLVKGHDTIHACGFHISD